MPELDAERRERLAEAARDVLDRCTCTPFPQGEGPEIDCPMHGRADFQGLAAADALAPLVAGWLADAWDDGYVAADHLTHRGVAHPCAAADRDNPYRAGEGA